MILNRKEQWITFCTVNGVLLAVVFLLFPLYYKYLMNLPSNKCHMLELFHLYCPACGGTRAFKAICEFDIVSSFVYNPIVPIGAIALVFYEFGMIKYLVKKTDREVFAKPWIIIAFLIFWFVYFIVRNVLLFYGIDLIGDIIK